jgi:hypothetical protein
MCANYVLNHSPTKALRVITLYEAGNGRKPMVSHMPIFDCLAYALCHHNNVTNLMIRQRNVYLLDVVVRVKVIDYIIH